MTTTSPALREQCVIVVGSGLAGLAAASQLVTNNVPVHMLERMSKPGGNAIKASSGINGAPTRFQPEPDNQFYDDTVKSAGAAISQGDPDRLLRESLISVLTKSSADAVYWLADEKKVDLSKVCQLGGHSRPRTHRGAGTNPPGRSIIGALLNSLETNSQFHLHTNCKVTNIIRELDEIKGVGFTREDGRMDTLVGPVVVTSGGFAGDSHGMLAKYRPDLAGFPSTNEPREGSQPLLTAVGARLLDMDRVQVHPTGFVDVNSPSSPVKFLAAEALRGEGGILLLPNGSRFVNELGTREYITNIIRNIASPTTGTTTLQQWDLSIVLDEGSAAAVGSSIDFYTWKGLLRKEIVKNLGPEAISSLQTYADAASGKTKDPFGRQHFGHWTLKDVTADSAVYVGKVTPVVHFTMGGVAINERSEVLDKETNQPIRGLWAAGEVTGGIHGDNRLGGSSLLECVIFGRIAGEGAAEFYKENYESGMK
ncbi:hypothetical protein DTO282F9_3881 [Paecilomyces variotii]|nr:hypothetical protein DTO282E5_4341 [Paecilomyces variotii]KAJ9399258.1 hypothetical protein DTO282F9_3881 [Paecilomyces variotii]